MNDTELADALVERGICEKENSINSTMYYIFSDASDGEWVDANDFVRDARVAMDCMEKAFALGCDLCPDSTDNVIEAIWDSGKRQCIAVKIEDSFTRAICMAFVEATK